MMRASPRTRLLLSSCAMLAALASTGSARAQVSAIQGTGTIAAGSGAIDNVGGTAAAPRTNVQVNSQTLVINWTPSDTSAGATPIDFLPANGLAYFYSSDIPEFTVLNRIIPATTRQVGLNGEVMGAVQPSGPASATPAGNIWFYSPTGIVAGSNSHFTANGLILTANDIPFTAGPSGGIDFGPNGEIAFTAAAGSQAEVALLPGARITNSSNNAYTLLVAPRVVQGGTIELDGSVGLIAAEKASVIIQNSLFDIHVDIGTSVANAIVHTGSTGAGPLGATLDGAQRVVIVATPQNTALTVLLGGNLGAAAANATNADRAVILSGGYDYNDSLGGLDFAPQSATPVNFQIGTASFKADLTALTTGSITGSPSRGEAIDFLGNAMLTAGTDVGLTADLDETINAAQNLTLVGAQSATLKLGTTNAEAGLGLNPATVKVTGDLTVSAENIGIDAGLGARAGTATISLEAGAVGPQLTVGGDTLVSARAFGAETAEVGGDGFGGTAQIVANGGTLSLQTTTIDANGRGADGTSGGSGTGGLASFAASDAAGFSIGDLTINAEGTAGSGNDPTAPGIPTGTGGTARFINQGTAAAAAGSHVVTGNLSLQASGDGGLILGQPGPNAVAGLVQLSNLASGANGQASFAAVDMRAQGRTAPANSGALIESAAGITAIGDSLNVDTAGPITVTVTGGGTISAGTLVNLASTLGDIAISHAGQSASPLATITGRDLFIDANGSIQAGPGTLLSASGTSLLRARTGSITADSLTAADDLAIHALDNVSLRSASTTGSPGGISITAGVDPVELVGTYLPVDVTVSGAVNAGGQLDVHAGRDVLGSGLSSLEGQSVRLIAERDISGAQLTIRSRSDLDLAVGRDLLAGSIDVAGLIDMIDIDGTVLLPGQLSIARRLGLGSLILRGPTAALVLANADLTIGQTQASGLDAASTGGALTLGGLGAWPGGASAFLRAAAPTVSLAGIAVTGNVDASATSTTLTAGSVTAGGAVTLTAATDLAGTGPVQGRSVTLNAPGAITLAGVSATGGDIVAAPGGALSLQNAAASGAITLGGSSVTLGTAQAGTALTVTTPGTFAVNTLATGATVRASSSDVALAAGGRIGTAGTTTLVQLTNNSTRRSFYGGADTAAGYSLSAAEIGQLYGDSITLIAPLTAQSAPATPDVTIGDMTVTGRAASASGQLGAQGSFTIQTPGRVAIGGAVKFTGLGGGETFAIGAGPQIALDNQTGSVELLGANNALAGRIDFSAASIVAASSAAQTALAGLTDPVAIDRLLGTNDGRVNDAGVLRAGSMLFTVANGLYIQNTGAGTAYAARRGFAVGTGGLAVNIRTSLPAPVVINGQATNTLGTLASGVDAIPLVTINGRPAPSSTGSLAGSTINGCDFTNVDGCKPPLPPEIALTRDRVEKPVEKPFETPSDTPSDTITVLRQVLAMPGVELQDIGPLGYDPLIDEPVTGSGNDDLWLPRCDPAKAQNCP